MKSLRPVSLFFLLAMPFLAQSPAVIGEAKANHELPSKMALLAELSERQEAQRVVAESYTHLEKETTRMIDLKGKIIKIETKEFENVRIQGHLIKRLLRVNGQPISDADQAKENARVQKEALEAAEDSSGASTKKINILSLLKSADIDDVEREQGKDGSLLVLSFKPSKGLKPKTRAEELISKLAGKIFVNEASRKIVRVDSRLTDSVGVWGGILGSIAKDSTITLEFSDINSELTTLSKTQMNFNIRALFTHMKLETETVFYEFQKFSMDPVTISAPIASTGKNATN